jgi:hypothetical protein
MMKKQNKKERDKQRKKERKTASNGKTSEQVKETRKLA